MSLGGEERMAYSTKEILEKYQRKLETQLNSNEYSREYTAFRGEMDVELSRYERWVNALGNLIRIKISEKDRIRIGRDIQNARLNVTPEQAVTFSAVAMLGIFFLTVLSAVAYYIIAFPGGLSTISNAELSNIAMFIFLGLLAGAFIFYFSYTMPARLANTWRLRASAQMVPAILYLVVYMKHTSNLERAVAFAAQHLEGPLALDFRKILYDVEIGKYPTIRQALGEYLKVWKDYAPEFIESVHLIESSLLEPGESRRVEVLEKSLQVILDGVYEKMLKYSRDIRSPLTNVYMLGIILPTLGLALLPLASTLLQGTLQWPHVFLFFNLIIPFFVYYMVGEVLLKRPGGYGEASSIENNPFYSEYVSRKPWVKGILIALPFFLLGIAPFIFQSDVFGSVFGIEKDYTFSEIGFGVLGDTKLFDFKDVEGNTKGPFGPLAVLLSLFIPLSIGLMFSIVYREKTKNLVKVREDSRALEGEFANSLFQLGNRLGDGIPAEIAFGQVAEMTQGQKTSNFFSLVSENVHTGGMSLDRAIFDSRRGAVTYYPSALVSTSMRILTESVKKGLNVAARALVSISEYVKNIGKINQRLRDLLAEIISDMKSNMTFLAPLLAGIVVGLSAMITFILNKLELLQIEAGAGEIAGLGNFGQIVSIFDVSTVVPPYFVQLSIGIYIVEVIFILTGALVSLDAGKDVLKEKSEISKNLKKGLLLYLITAFISVFSLGILASIALGSMGG